PRPREPPSLPYTTLFRSERNAARIALPPELPVARHLHRQAVGEGVDDRQADAMQAARGLVDIGRELAAGMQLGQHDLERRLTRIDRKSTRLNSSHVKISY